MIVNSVMFQINAPNFKTSPLNLKRNKRNSRQNDMRQRLPFLCWYFSFHSKGTFYIFAFNYTH